MYFSILSPIYSLEQRTNEILERKLRRVSETRRETLHMLSRAPSLTSLSSRYSDTVDKDEIAKYEYPFENLVFEGGGAKGLAYCGVIRVSVKLNHASTAKKPS